MMRRSDIILIIACIVLGLAVVHFRAHHFGFGPLGWTNSGGRSVSLSFVALMIELELRCVATAAGTVFTIC
jgi:hypothetical protein